MSNVNALTVWQERLAAIARSVPNPRAAEQALFEAEAELGTQNLPLLIDRIPLSDLRVLAESADSSVHSALLAHLSPHKLAELLDYQMRQEQLFPDAFSPFSNILFGTFFSEDIQENEDIQLLYLDAIFDHRLDLVEPILHRLLEAFSNGDKAETNPFIHPDTEPDSSVEATPAEDLGIFTHWFSENCNHHYGECDDAGPKAFLLCVCTLRPEYAMTISDLYIRQTQERVAPSTPSIPEESAHDQPKADADRESMF